MKDTTTIRLYLMGRCDLRAVKEWIWRRCEEAEVEDDFVNAVVHILDDYKYNLNKEDVRARLAELVK